MPRTGDTYNLPAGGAVAGTEAKAVDVTAPLADLAAEQNLVRPISAGGTGASTATAARTALGLAIGTDVQAYDAGLASVAGLTTAADKMIYTTAADTYAVTDLTSFARTLLDDSDAATVRGTLGLVIGTDVQAYDADTVKQPSIVTASLYTTYGGTANAITLTTPLSLSAYATGQEFRFRATATNTGATTINVDGIGAKTAKTVTGAALPADYIRTDIDTVCRYDGTDFIVSRETERGSNANGDYIRWANGQMKTMTTSVEVRSGSGTTTTTVTLPATFASNTIAPQDILYAPQITLFTTIPSAALQATVANQSTTSIDVMIYRTTNVNTPFSLTIDGTWY